MRVQLRPKLACFELRVDNKAPLLPFQLAKVCLGGAETVHSCSVKLDMTMLLKHVQYGGTILEVGHAGLAFEEF